MYCTKNNTSGKFTIFYIFFFFYRLNIMLTQMHTSIFNYFFILLFNVIEFKIENITQTKMKNYLI